jgi:hypothetical protein
MSRCYGYICEFLTNTSIVVYSIKISRDRGQYKVISTTKYYRGSMPRYLDKKEYVEEDWFLTLSDLFNSLKYT